MRRFGASFRAATAGQWRNRRLLLAVIPLLTLIALAPGVPLWGRVTALMAQGAVLLALSQRRRNPRHSVWRGQAAVQALCDLSPEGQGSGAALVLRLDDAAQQETRLGRLRLAALMAILERRLLRALTRNAALWRMPQGAGFAVALHPCHRLDTPAAMAFATSLRGAVSADVYLWGHRLRPSLSIGVSLCDRMRQPGEPDALQAAMAACARALSGGPMGLETDSVCDLMAHRLHRNTGELLDALESRAITAHFQPQVCLRSGAVTGCEALARWQHPVRGLVSPAAFLPAIAAADLNTTLTLAMLRDALGLLGMLERRGLHLPTVSINLTEQDLRRTDLPDRIAWELDRHDLTPERLVLEILESVTTDGESDQPVRTIARLAEMGCRIDLDDYGTGNASILGIRRFAVDRLKIDRSYVRQLDSDARQRQMVGAILSMARALDLETLAEGVETPAEQEILVTLGCDHVQGFGIARPMPADAFVDWMATRAGQSGERESAAPSRIAGPAARALRKGESA